MFFLSLETSTVAFRTVLNELLCFLSCPEFDILPIYFFSGFFLLSISAKFAPKIPAKFPRNRPFSPRICLCKSREICLFFPRIIRSPVSQKCQAFLSSESSFGEVASHPAALGDMKSALSYRQIITNNTSTIVDTDYLLVLPFLKVLVSDINVNQIDSEEIAGFIEIYFTFMDSRPPLMKDSRSKVNGLHLNYCICWSCVTGANYSSNCIPDPLYNMGLKQLQPDGTGITCTLSLSENLDSIQVQY